ncbi:MAG: hypothetical protein KF782_18370 [Labilithrix sp.]|nr:hypothetical protein [Labilithrix sp.]
MHGVAAVLVAVGTSACAPSSRPEPAPPADAPHEGSSAAPAREAPPADERAADARADDVAAVPAASVATPADAGAGVDAARVAIADAGAGASTAGAEAHVKIVTIGMHVAGGPYDEPTKVPFKKAVEPRFPEIAQCWAAHVTKPPKQADFGVDLLIEAAGGKPKVSNPRSTLDKGETQGFTACVVGVFESVDFPKLVGRGRTGVSYSLRFTPR